ncbi:diguanylate cyclase with PAS/PAC and GAF sensors [Nostoc sp. NIES-2111]|nr:diguanylate cyclase with PAS/PAC and GAF sensors [Nostoc sp. NIES-2111]
MVFNRLSSTEICLEQILCQIRMLAVQIHQSSQLDEILKVIVSESRKILESDRVVSYRFLTDSDGVVQEESVSCECSVSPQNISVAELKAFERLQTPIWIYDIQNLQMWWANKASLYIWNAQSREELLQRDSDISEATRIRLQNYLHQFEQGKTVAENWTFYPEGKPVSVRCMCSGVYIEDGRLAMLVEGTTQLTDDINQETKQQLAEEELRWQEALLLSMTDTSLLAFFVVDNRTDEILYFNHRFCQIWEIEHLEARMRSGELKNNDIIPDCAALIADVPKFAESCKPLQSEDNRCTIEDEILFIDGRTIRRFSSQIRDERDKYFGRLYIFEDISERKQLEKTLLLTDYSFECIGISGTWIDRNAKILRVNEAACRLLGYSRTELESMYVYELDPDFPQQAWTSHWQELKEQKCMTFISQHRTKDGRLIPVEVTLNYVEFDGEEYNFAFARDISEQQAAMVKRIEAETALRESEERYRSVILAMAEGIVLQQADGHITACNQSAERILGLTAEQMMGLCSIDPQWRAIHADGSPFSGETHPALVTLQTGQPQYNIVMGVYKPDGSLTWISINSQPLFQPDELTPYAVVTSFTDITVQKQAGQALQQQAQRERMIYAIAQHIRQSLDLDKILNTTVAEVREFLQSDRVIIYRFNPDWSGVVVTESVAQGWQSLLNQEITDSYFVETKGQIYQQGTIKITSNIYTAGFAPYHVKLLEQMQVKAKLVVPILQGDNLWGLLVAHHCSVPHEWLPWESKLLQQLATQLAIAIQQSELYYQLQTANQELQNLAMVDQLTGIANRRCFDNKLICLWPQLLQEENYVSLLLCDIDYFKQYNDTYGHAAGDDCLRLVAQAFQQTVKHATDLAARYGGEEFVVILSNTDIEGAALVAQEIHQAIQKLNILHTASAIENRVTLSIGIATVIPTSELVPLDLVEAADQALYQAKAQGRNRSFFREC